jgi:hypothetical protein
MMHPSPYFNQLIEPRRYSIVERGFDQHRVEAFTGCHVGNQDTPRAQEFGEAGVDILEISRIEHQALRVHFAEPHAQNGA